MTISIVAIAIVSFLVSAATGTPPPPDFTGLAAMVTAGVGIVAFLISLWRGRENNKKIQGVEDTASYVKGFEALVNRLQTEVTTLSSELSGDRQQWAKEKQQLQEIIDRLRSDLTKQIASNMNLRSEIVDMREQIKAWLSAEEYDEFKKRFPRDSRS